MDFICNFTLDSYNSLLLTRRNNKILLPNELCEIKQNI